MQNFWFQKFKNSKSFVLIPISSQWCTLFWAEGYKFKGQDYLNEKSWQLSRKANSLVSKNFCCFYQFVIIGVNSKKRCVWRYIDWPVLRDGIPTWKETVTGWVPQKADPELKCNVQDYFLRRALGIKPMEEKDAELNRESWTAMLAKDFLGPTWSSGAGMVQHCQVLGRSLYWHIK